MWTEARGNPPERRLRRSYRLCLDRHLARGVRDPAGAYQSTSIRCGPHGPGELYQTERLRRPYSCYRPIDSRAADQDDAHSRAAAIDECPNAFSVRRGKNVGIDYKHCARLGVSCACFFQSAFRANMISQGAEDLLDGRAEL